jgi:uncharacterized protein YbjQ (UPF0145 family)
MRIVAGVFVFLVAAFPASGTCAQAASTDAVPVYDPTEVAHSGYTVLKRLWVEDWKSVFRIAGHRDQAAARRALLNEAAALGADAVVNLYCLDRTDGMFNPAGYFCYGNAIKIKTMNTK